MRKKMLMLATTAAMIEQFNKNNILILEEMGYEVHVIGNWKVGNPISEERLSEFRVWLGEHHGKWFHMDSTRKPYDLKNNVSAYKKVVKLIEQHNYNFIHCHTPIGSVIARLAAHKTNTKVIYTAHGFHFYDGAPIINWLLYYPVEKLLSYWTDVLITINKEDYNRAKCKFHAKSTEYVPGVGVDVEKYVNIDIDRDAKRKELGLEKDDFAILSVGELNENKNHGVVIQAIKELNDPQIKYYICGQGPLKKEYEELIDKNNLKKNILLLGYRSDVSEICRAMDLFVFPSKREGLSVALMEAMASGLPVISSNIRGNKDIVKMPENGYLFEIKEHNRLPQMIIEMMINRQSFEIFAVNNKSKVKQFSYKIVNEKMKKVYAVFR